MHCQIPVGVPKLRNGCVVPIKGHAKHIGVDQVGRVGHVGIVVLVAARLDDGDGDVGVLGQPVGEEETGCAATCDDVVELETRGRAMAVCDDAHTSPEWLCTRGGVDGERS